MAEWQNGRMVEWQNGRMAFIFFFFFFLLFFFFFVPCTPLTKSTVFATFLPSSTPGYTIIVCPTTVLTTSRSSTLALEEMPRESYITLTESAHYPDAKPIWLAKEAHICYSIDLWVA